MRRLTRSALTLAAAAAAVALAGAADARKPARHWRADDVQAPASFVPWKGAPAIKLPASRPAFEAYLKRLGARWVEDGALPGGGKPNTMHVLDKVPAPYKGAVEFEWKDATADHFNAYVDNDDRVVWVEWDFLGEVN